MNVKGMKISGKTSASDLVESMAGAGFQATELGRAVEVIREMKRAKATVFLTFTSNLVSSGLRELFAQLCEERFVDGIITSIGSVEEDLMKTHAPFELGSFNADDADLHKRGINRIGNIFVPNARYEWLEKFLQPFFAKELQKQKTRGKLLSPSELIRDLGLSVRDKNSFVFQAAKNNIPVFCPAPTDGAFGLQVYFFKQNYPEFGIDVTGDMSSLEQMVFNAKKTGGIVLGGGFAKHYLIGANLLRGGLDYAVYVTTATQYDGSLSGARVNEAVSWGKINAKAKAVTVEGDATILFPLMIAGWRR